MSDPTPPVGPPEPVEPTPPAVPAAEQPPATPPPPPPPPAYSPPPPATAGPPAGAAAFNVGDAFGWGWKKFTENVGPIVLALLVYVAIIFAVVVVWTLLVRGILVSSPSITVNPQTGAISTDGGSGLFVGLLANALSIFVFVALSAFLTAALVRGALILADGDKKLEVGDMFKFDNFATVFVAALIVGALTFVGFFFCFVGAFVVWFFTSFYMFFLIDKGLGAWDSVKASFDFVKDNLGQVALLVLLAAIVYSIGAALCFVGLIVAAPVAFLALTYGYRKLQGEPVAA
ncbi:MAG TPA: hypothetical protein VEV13_01900 [Candidatus Limnocylindria bacterium]|nr:hypothetical protein [Candidatus Limnocylindria bacterium]